MIAGELAWAEGPRTREEALSAWPLAREVFDYIVAAGPVMKWMIAREMGLSAWSVEGAVEYLNIDSYNGFGRLIDRCLADYKLVGGPLAVWLWSPEALGEHPTLLTRRVETCRLYFARMQKERAA